MKGAPASFPVREEYVPLQHFLQWSDSIEQQVTSYVDDNLGGEKFIGIHLRNGPDWVRTVVWSTYSINLVNVEN
jgi:peptide-O-fucosyltransferase